MTAFRKPWTTGNMVAYHSADSIAAAIEGFRRARRAKSFILTGGFAGVKCAAADCGKPITDRANRGQYDAETKKVRVLHYDCSWGETLGLVAALGRRVYGQ
jgi:hypothetical protein